MLTYAKRLLIAPLAALGLALSGCATGPNGVVTVDPNFIASVQSISATVCSIVPTVESILAIFNSGIASTATAVSNAVCGAAPKPASARFLALPLRASGSPPAQVGIIGSVSVNGWRVGGAGPVFQGRPHRIRHL